MSGKSVRIDPPSGSPLADAAFGAHPDLWPLPAASSAREGWWRAVAAAGQGYYGTAFSELDRILRIGDGGPLSSLAHSTRASLLRQLGWHARARTWDGRALALALDSEARVDALVGLAADALGVGRFAASDGLLGAACATPEPAPERCAVRVQWVSAELAMATGNGVDAVAHARRGVDLAGSDQVSVRHRIKSDVVLAAALCCDGQVDDARSLADRLLDDTAEFGLVPLRWAVASLLVGIGSKTHSVGAIAQIRDAEAALVEHRGGIWWAR